MTSMEQPAGKKRILNEEEYKRVLKEDDDIEKRKDQPEIYEIFNKIKKQWVKTKQKEKARRKKLQFRRADRGRMEAD